MIFIIKGFQTIVFIFIVISITFWPICPPAIFRCLLNSGTFMELRTTSFIESMGLASSDSVSHNRVQVLNIPVLLLAYSQDWLQPPDDCLLRTPITVMLCVLLDNSEGIFGTYKLNVLTWLGILLLCKKKIKKNLNMSTGKKSYIICNLYGNKSKRRKTDFKPILLLHPTHV